MLCYLTAKGPAFVAKVGDSRLRDSPHGFGDIVNICTGGFTAFQFTGTSQISPVSTDALRLGFEPMLEDPKSNLLSHHTSPLDGIDECTAADAGTVVRCFCIACSSLTSETEANINKMRKHALTKISESHRMFFVLATHSTLNPYFRAHLGSLWICPHCYRRLGIHMRKPLPDIAKYCIYVPPPATLPEDHDPTPIGDHGSYMVINTINALHKKNFGLLNDALAMAYLQRPTQSAESFKAGFLFAPAGTHVAIDTSTSHHLMCLVFLCVHRCTQR